MPLIELREKARVFTRSASNKGSSVKYIRVPAKSYHSLPADAKAKDIKLKYLLQSNDPYIKLLSQFCLLKQLFPDFPTKMLTTLLLKEEGAGKKVAKSLIKKGWNPTSDKILMYLSKSSSEVFCCNYYWGKLDENI